MPARRQSATTVIRWSISPLTSVLYRNAGSRFEDISKQSGVGISRQRPWRGGDRRRRRRVARCVCGQRRDAELSVSQQRQRDVHREASLAGVAVTAGGNAKAGMGTAFADFSGNGRPGLIVTNHETEMHSLFVNLDGRLFSDVTVRSGVGRRRARMSALASCSSITTTTCASTSPSPTVMCWQTSRGCGPAPVTRSAISSCGTPVSVSRT